METKTVQIFNDACPYDNSSQTNALRIVFVCSVGMLRSPTAQAVATRRGHNARAAGSCTDIALVPLSCNLINWAQYIIFMNGENFDQALAEFDAVGYHHDIRDKATVWDIGDNFDWGDQVLWNIIEDNLTRMGL
jgi:predicted protein tyrosine phosphatase